MSGTIVECVGATHQELQSHRRNRLALCNLHTEGTRAHVAVHSCDMWHTETVAEQPAYSSSSEAANGPKISSTTAQQLEPAGHQKLCSADEAGSHVQLCCCFIGVLQVQVPISWSPAKHRSTQIDTERVLPGTSDSHGALAALSALHSLKQPAHASCKASRAHSSKRTTAAAAGKQAAPSKAAECEPQPATVYNTEFCKDASEQQRLSQLTATRRVLQGSSEWALLDHLEHSIAEQEVSSNTVMHHCFSG